MRGTVTDMKVSLKQRETNDVGCVCHSYGHGVRRCSYYFYLRSNWVGDILLAERRQRMNEKEINDAFDAEYAKLPKSSFNRKRQIQELGLIRTTNPYRDQVIEEVAQHIEQLKGFGKDTINSFAIYIRSMKK